MVTPVSDEENPMLLHKPKEEKKKSYLQGENLPLTKETTLGSLKKSWDNAKVRPYVGIRDFNNGPDTNGENESVLGIDAGIRFSF